MSSARYRPARSSALNSTSLRPSSASSRARLAVIFSPALATTSPDLASTRSADGVMPRIFSATNGTFQPRLLSLTVMVL